MAITHNFLCVRSSTRHNEAITTTDRQSAVHVREVSNALLITHQAGDDSVLSTIPTVLMTSLSNCSMEEGSIYKLHC